jgi:hypothetical protein
MFQCAFTPSTSALDSSIDKVLAVWCAAALPHVLIICTVVAHDRIVPRGGTISSITLRRVDMQVQIKVIACTIAPHRMACPALRRKERKLSLFSDVNAEGAVKKSHKTLKRQRRREKESCHKLETLRSKRSPSLSDHLGSDSMQGPAVA